MIPVDIIFRYFPELTAVQKDQFSKLYEVYHFWNEQINVVSRKDFEFFYERHVLHSLGIAKAMPFNPGAEILDVGTGGGFPGIPLAILFPETKFHLVDSIGKKIKVVSEVSKHLGLTNVTSEHKRAEEIKNRFDFVVSRAVTQMGDFIPWVQQKFKSQSKHSLPNGILYLKGGDLSEELKGIKHPVKIRNLSDFFREDFFETKKVVYVNMSGRT